MSFSSETKEELCRISPERICCHLAELSGIVSSAGSVLLGSGGRRLFVETENERVAERCRSLLQSVFDVQPTLVTRAQARLGGRKLIRLVLSGEEASFVMEGCGISLSERRGVPKEITARKCCRMSFLRGAFLACGSVADPDREYHLEFVLDDESFGESLARMIAKFGLSARTGQRRRMTLVYLKGQADITDMLSLMGAQEARFRMEDAFIRKGFRNAANRAVNCDSANLSRTVLAAERQTAAIRAVLELVGAGNLPAPLLEIAELRLANPELSLEELGALCDPPVGKSGANHRLKRLLAIAEEKGLSGKPEPPAHAVEV
ncbi:MAG: DNA-binding protein WhiA [Clostridiales bacterium]|nr:DNA-binding protein WhiA [Clostridiales bacterium]